MHIIFPGPTAHHEHRSSPYTRRYFVRFFPRNDEFSYVATSQAGLFSNTSKVYINRLTLLCTLLSM